MKEVQIKSTPARVKKVREILYSVGNRIGAVHFKRRKDGTLRKMCYRLHTTNPSYAVKPNGKRFKQNKEKDTENLQMTVFDVNKVVRDKKGRICGRGAWRCIPLENVIRVKVNGEIFRIKS